MLPSVRQTVLVHLGKRGKLLPCGRNELPRVLYGQLIPKGAFAIHGRFEAPTSQIRHDVFPNLSGNWVPHAVQIRRSAEIRRAALS